MNLIISLLNTLAILGTLGLLVYTKLLFKKPVITEASQKKVIAATYASPKPPPVAVLVKFDPITVNISGNPDRPLPADGTSRQMKGKLHYVTTGFSLQIQDQGQQDLVEGARPIILDLCITLLGKKKFEELTTVQGRYILKSQLLEMINQKIIKLTDEKIKTPVVTDLFFNQFIVQ